MADLPHNGHFSKAPDRRFDSTIVFVHHFGGTYQSSWRHQKLVNELGFDAVAFDLEHNRVDGWPLFREVASDALHGKLQPWSTTWKNQILDVLNAIAGPKIIYSFSSPSAAVLRLLAEDRPANVHAWIADCGPFLDARACIGNYYHYQTHIPRALIPFFSVFGAMMIGGPGYETKAIEWIQQLSRTFPILSIRSGRDELVPLDSIERLFAASPVLNLKVLEIEGCEHLEGLKTHASLYAPAVAAFLGASL